ncbi:formimidoylglutamate deiminase [Microbacterium capsulatum]|uniref:Formimidoylglutamate deiminase n=1 Tax=Microbacterium capsulatum TaxID=3041921 RepID=A0ABU0XJ29_9MICO|nr:formimidoylglutamate deiminase [Microbacterium sp. ASV81]MDQ4215142.1 formimidoylglutamate deiminase [Microbacterium sp. ASV81]
MSLWCERLVTASGTRERVRIEVDAEGMVASITADTDVRPDDISLGTVLPGVGNAHSHAFHRVLRGRTHADGGDFWVWRRQMYEAAGRLDPENYHELARAVFAEMLTAGYTAVGEFHYAHHRPDGSRYAAHDMEEAISAAAADVGIRLTLLDTAYLQGGIGQPLSPEQQRFGDDSAERYLERWSELRGRIPRLGAALHSVRALTPDEISRIVAGLPGDVPVHIHLSEQPAENEASLATYGATPTELLAERGVLSPRLSAVHATHLTDRDIELLGGAGVSVVMCPTTEADLGDGIGPARALKDAGATLALGSDQNAVVDAMLEMRALEMQDRLASGARGRFSPAEALHAAGSGGYRSLGWAQGPLEPGGPADLIEVRTDSLRTVGADPEQLIFAATASDLTRVFVGGRVVVTDGVLASGEEPAQLLARGLGAFSR